MNYSVNAKLPLADLALRPDPSRASPWLREALAAEGDPAPAAPLAGEARADIGIVGGGYTGLWTALELKIRAPELEVIVLEQEICGAGPSGRNGGFVNAWWDELDTLRALHGDDEALVCAREVARSVSAIGEWAAAEGEDVHYRRGGMLTVSTTPLHDGVWRASVEAARELGVPDAYSELDADAVAARCRGGRFRGGALMADGGTVHPGRLVRALRRACLARGVRLFEETRAGRLWAGDRVRIATMSRAGPGELRASQCVLALNAWTAGRRPFRRSLLAWSSWMVRSEPIPELIAERLGWTGGESIVDGRFTVHYFHVTRDGRIAFGAGGGRPGYDGRIGRSFRDDLGSGRRAAAGFRRLFPQLADVRLTDMWGGPIDVSADHLPRFGTLPGGRVHFGFGYSGNGVAPSHLGGRILSSLALGSDEPVTRLAVVGDVPRRLPPEPFRYLGARVVRAAMIRREDREEAGYRPSWPLRQITRLPRRLGFRLGPE